MLRIIDMPRSRDHFKYLLPWLLSLAARSNTLSRRTPWIVYAARDHIETRLSPESSVFEFGGGGSTLWFADHGCRVVTIEHDREWYERIRERLRPAQQSRVTLRLIEPDVRDSREDGDSELFTSADPRYTGKTFASYTTFIDRFDDGTFDVVLVDGRSRASCLIRAWPKVSAGGVIVLDNSDRERYYAAMNRLPGEGRCDYFGPASGSRWYWRTTVWEKRDKYAPIRTG